MYDWEEDLYLEHYGVKGMKWGVHKAQKALTDFSSSRKKRKNERLEKKQVKQQLKADKYYAKAKKRADSSKLALKAAKQNVIADKALKKAVKLDPNDAKYLKLNRKAAKAKYKAAKYSTKVAIRNLSNVMDTRLKIKGLKQEQTAAKLRMLIAKNNVSINRLDKRSERLGKQIIQDAIEMKAEKDARASKV